MRWIALKVLCVGVCLCSLTTQAQEQTRVTTVDFELRSGLIVLNVAVNGTPMKFILDTGASGVILFAKTAEELELEKESIGWNSTSGGAVSASRVRVDSLAVGDLVRSGCVCLVLELSHISAVAGDDVAGVLGHDFLSQYRITINYRQKRVSFEWRPEQDKLFVDPRFGLEVRRPDTSWAFETKPSRPEFAVVLTHAHPKAGAIVMVQELRGRSLHRDVSAFEEELPERVEDFEMVSSAGKRYGEKDAHVVEFTGKKGDTKTRFRCVFFILNESMCCVTCSAPASVFDEVVDDFEKIVESVRSAEPAGADAGPPPDRT
jgi:clan AA aspartic protease (TIGR02281 family)